MLRIVVERAGEVVRDGLFAQQWVSLGRDPGNDVMVDDPLVSAQHLLIRSSAAGSFRLFDQSSNGTFLEGQPIKTLRFDAPTALTVGDFQVTLIPVIRSGTDQAPMVDLTAPTLVDEIPTGAYVRATPAPRNRPGAVELRCVTGKGELRSFIFEQSALVGRASDCDLRFDSRDISRRHCLIFAGTGGYLLKRLSSKNPVLINDQTVAEGQAITLRDGDVIRICDEEMVFLYPATRRKEEIAPKLPEQGSPNLSLDVRRRSCSDSSVAAFDLIGFLGAKTVRRFEDELTRELQRARRILLDLGYLVGIDGTGINSLGRVLSKARELGVTAQLIRVTPRVADLLADSTTGRLFGPFISNTEETAIRRLRG